MGFELRRQAVLLTPAGRGAVATVHAEGLGVLEAVSKWFHPASGRSLAESPISRIVYGRWAEGEAGEELVVCRRSEEEIEIHCHGGRAASDRILQALADSGFATQDWRDWVRGGDCDLIAVEARVALAEARTERAAQTLLDQYQGALRNAIQQVLCACDAKNAAEGATQIDEILRHEQVGRHLTAAWKVVVAGAPNVGKSSLVNAILGYERAIVFDQPGTTRDVLTALTALDGWPVEIADTAGMRETADDIETQGVARAREQIAAADLVLLVFDVTEPWTRAEARLLVEYPAALVVHNKCDLATTVGSRSGVHTSAKTGAGIDELLCAISRRLVPDSPPIGAAVPFTDEQCRVLREAHGLLYRNELLAARETLRGLT